LDLSARTAKEVEADVRDFSVHLSPRLVNNTDPKQPIEWTVRGRVRAALRLERRQIDFGRQSERLPIPPQRLLVTALVPVRRLSVPDEKRGFPVRITRSAADPARFELEVAPGPSQAAGAVDFPLHIVAETEDGERLPGKKFLVVGSIVPDLQATPPTVLFGAVAVGETAEETVHLHALSGQPFEVTGCRCEGVDAAVERLPAASPQEVDFRVRVPVRAAGEQRGQIVFSVTPKDAESITVVVPLAQHGIAAAKE
jgi:hypothetical protein